MLFFAITLRSRWWKWDAAQKKHVVAEQIDVATLTAAETTFAVEVFVPGLKATLLLPPHDIYRLDDAVSKLAALDCETWKAFVGAVPASG